MGMNWAKHIERKFRAQQREKCRAKIRYDSWDDAVKASKSQAKKHGNSVGQGAYVCPVCGGYHLTSNSPLKVKRGARGRTHKSEGGEKG